MKASIKPLYAKWHLLFSLVLFTFLSCEKGGPNFFNETYNTYGQNTSVPLRQTKMFSSDVLIKWLNMQLGMLGEPLLPGTGTQGAERWLAYCGIAVYESVVPGMPAYKSLFRQLIDFPAMPVIEHGKEYHWAASANAALAFMNRQLFPTASARNKAAMDALENSLQSQYATEVDDATLQRSIYFGKQVAASIAYWAARDGSANVNPAYIPPVGPGLWMPIVSTSPINSYARQRRLLVPDIATDIEISPPPAYSTEQASLFYSMVKDVYDKSLVLTPDQKAMAIYHNDISGYPEGSHFVAVLSQALLKTGADLEVAAQAFVKTGIGYHDAVILGFTKEYKVNLLRPITYIRDVMGHSKWDPLSLTPNHPEFPSTHAVNSAAVAWMLTSVFGDHFSFTLDIYNYLGLPARNYTSFKDMSIQMSNSGVFGGIHYQASCDKGILLGEMVGQNILTKVKFLKY